PLPSGHLTLLAVTAPIWSWRIASWSRASTAVGTKKAALTPALFASSAALTAAIRPKFSRASTVRGPGRPIRCRAPWALALTNGRQRRIRSAYSSGASMVSMAVLVLPLSVSTDPGRHVVAIKPKHSLSQTHARQTAVLRPPADRVRIDPQELSDVARREEIG